MAPKNPKPLALLIPGLDGTGKLYDRQIGLLAGKYRVQPWHFRPRDAFNLGDLVDEIAQGTQDEREPMLVVGESFGGLVAIQFVLDYPVRVRQLALVNSFPFYRRRIRIRLGCRLARLLDRPAVMGIKDYVVERTLAAEGIPPEDRLFYRQAIRQVHHPAYRRRLELVRDVDLRDRLREIRVPAHLFASGRDKLVPSIREARYMHSAIRGSRIHEFPHAGHALLLTPGFSLAEYLEPI